MKFGKNGPFTVLEKFWSLHGLFRLSRTLKNHDTTETFFLNHERTEIPTELWKDREKDYNFTRTVKGPVLQTFPAIKLILLLK